MMFALVDGQKKLATPEQIATCPSCSEDLIAKCGEIRVWHWSHKADTDCDTWAEPESEWHLGWKKHVPSERTELVIARNGVVHRADIIAANGAVLELQANTISSQEIQERESFYKHMAWLFRVTWADRIHYGKKGFWWKHGAISQTFIKRPLFWEFEEEGLVQQVKLSLADRSNRVLGYVPKTYTREQFIEFIVTGSIPTPVAADARGEVVREQRAQAEATLRVKNYATYGYDINGDYVDDESAE
jgi:competence CoiA-like predicted nuclease